MSGFRCALLRNVTHWYELLKRFVLRIVTHCLLPMDGVDLERPSIAPSLTRASPACSRCDLMVMRRPAAADAPVPPLLRLWVGHG